MVDDNCKEIGSVDNVGYNFEGMPINYEDLKNEILWIYTDSNNGVDHWMGIPKKK